MIASLALILFVWFGSSSFGSFGGLVQRGLVLLCYGVPLAIGLAATHGVPVPRQADDWTASQASRVSRY